MVLTVFCSRLREEARSQYLTLAQQMSDLARTMPGYHAHKVFVAEDGERVTIVEFEDDAGQHAWATNVEHIAAKKIGRESFYSEYSLQICNVTRESHFRR